MQRFGKRSNRFLNFLRLFGENRSARSYVSLVNIPISQIDDHDGFPINMHAECVIIIAGSAIGTRLLNALVRVRAR